MTGGLAPRGFISLFEALLEVEKLVELPVVIIPDSAEAKARRRIKAASLLHALLHHANEMGSDPKWFRLNLITRFPILDDQVAGDGINIMLWTAAWGHTMDDAMDRNDAIDYANAVAAASDPENLATLDVSPSRQKKPMEHIIGFERPAFEAFISQFPPQGVPDAELEANPASRPLPRQRWQEQQILLQIHELGHDPKFLPQREPGKAGVKAAVKEKLISIDRRYWHGTIFDEAWKRLRSVGEIGEGKTGPLEGMG